MPQRKWTAKQCLVRPSNQLLLSVPPFPAVRSLWISCLETVELFTILLFCTSRERREAEQREKERIEKERMDREIRERERREREFRERQQQAAQAQLAAQLQAAQAAHSQHQHQQQKAAAAEAVEDHFRMSMELAKKVG